MDLIQLVTAMNLIPNPLHPALVHFPIVLILLGTLVAVPAVIIRRWHLPWLAAILLGLGAVGAVAATWSGEEDAEANNGLSPQGEQILEEHEEWGERARNLALLAAAAAVTAAMLRRSPKASAGFAVFTALAAVGASFCVAEAGHYGGRLVYEYGIGVNLDSAKTGGTPPTARKDDD